MAETPATIEGVLAGVRKVVVEAEGYLPWSGDVAIEEGRAAYVNVTLVRRPVVR
jgi:hypothetical protein